MTQKFRLFSFLLLSFLLLSPEGRAWKSELIAALKGGGGYAVDDSGKVLFEHNASQHFIPASTIKVATAACALSKLGANYRFMTDFYLTPDDKLVMKGYGDPFLVSEEFAIIASHLVQNGLKHINGVIVDDSVFSPDIVLDGISRSSNPYDAYNGAVIANFNTLNVQKLKNGQIISGETQTPITDLAIELGKIAGLGKQRINLGTNRRNGPRYAGELLAAFLQKEGVVVNGKVELGTKPENARALYQHKSSKTVSDIVTGLLEYSTNFMANQLFLFMGAKEFGAPATQEKGAKVLTQFLRDEVGWQDFTVVEGSGLSRQNRVTPKQMIQLLEYFEPYKNLMPIKEGVFRAKTGTLNGVSTLTGFFTSAGGKLVNFALMVNANGVGYEYKFRVAKMLYQGLNGRNE